MAPKRAWGEAVGVPRAYLEAASAIQTIARFDEFLLLHRVEVDSLGLGTDNGAIAKAITALGAAMDGEE